MLACMEVSVATRLHAERRVRACEAGGCGRGVCASLVAERPEELADRLEEMRRLGLERVPGTGMLPLVVPGAFDAWMTLLRDLGTLRLRELLKNLHWGGGWWG